MPGTETGGSLKSNVEQYPIRRSFATNMKFSIFTKHNKTLKEIKKKKSIRLHEHNYRKAKHTSTLLRSKN